MRPPPSGRPWIALALAAGGFTLLFAGATFHFWVQMAVSVAGLCLAAFLFDPPGMRELLRPPRPGPGTTILLGLGSAALLYGVFFVANAAAGWLLAFGREEIAGVYGLKAGTHPGLIAALLILVIGPGEEVFWRGYVQRRFADRYGRWGLVLAMLAYAGVHLASGNLMLIAAAAVCAVFWGLLFQRTQSIWVNVISHTAWDVAVLLLWPLM